MSRSKNRVELIDYLGADPDIRTLQSKDRVASFSVATSEKWKDKSTGEIKEKIQWHRVVVYNKPSVEFVENYLRKGNLVRVEGPLEYRTWTPNRKIIVQFALTS